MAGDVAGNDNGAVTDSRSLVDSLVASGALDPLFERIDGGQIELTGDGGLLGELTRVALERGLQAAFQGDPRELAQQAAVAGELDLPAVYPFEQGVQRSRRDQRVHQGPRIRHGTIVIPGHIAGHRLHCLGHHDRFLSIR